MTTPTEAISRVRDLADVLGDHSGRFTLDANSRAAVAADLVALLALAETALTPASASPEVVRLPADVVRLVIAARIVTDDVADLGQMAELFNAVEAFSSRVPYENEPGLAIFQIRKHPA